MDFYQAIKEFCLDIGVNPESLSSPDALSDEDFMVVIREADLDTIRDYIEESKYYKPKIRKITTDGIYIIEKMFIGGSWVSVLITITENNFGVGVEFRTFNVDYFTEEGKNINVENIGIAKSLEERELEDIM